jgi:hypothetical protein
MSEKQEEMVSKKVAIALGVIVMVLFSGIIVVFAYFSSAVSLRDNIIAIKDEEILSLQSEIETLEGQVSDLQDQVEAQQNQIANLENQLASMTPASTAARVINVGLGARDERFNPDEPYLYVSGYVCNVGSETAYNVRLHVTAYRGSVEVINSYYDIVSSLGREDSEHIEAKFYYSGPELTPNSWTMTPDWT